MPGRPRTPKWAALALPYGLLALLLFAYAGRIANDVYVQTLVSQEKLDANVLASFPRLRALPDGAIALVTGIDLTNAPTLPWENGRFSVHELGGRRFELLAPDAVLRATRAGDNTRMENPLTSEANGDFVRANPPGYALTYDAGGSLVNIRPLAWGPGSNLDGVAALLPGLPELLNGHSVKDLPPAGRLAFERQAASWGLWSALRALPANAHPTPEERQLLALARLRDAESQAVSLTAAPAAGGGPGLQVAWNAPGASAVELHVASPDGPLVSSSGSVSSTDVLSWASAKTTFFLQDRTLDRPLTARYTLATIQGARSTANRAAAAVAVGAPPSRDFYADPNPILLDPGATVGKTTVHWNVPPGEVEVHVGSADGPLFSRGDGSGAQETGPWVSDGMTFYLVHHQSGAAPAVLATLTVRAAPR